MSDKGFIPSIEFPASVIDALMPYDEKFPDSTFTGVGYDLSYDEIISLARKSVKNNHDYLSEIPHAHPDAV